MIMVFRLAVSSWGVNEIKILNSQRGGVETQTPTVRPLTDRELKKREEEDRRNVRTRRERTRAEGNEGRDGGCRKSQMGGVWGWVGARKGYERNELLGKYRD